MFQIFIFRRPCVETDELLGETGHGVAQHGQDKLGQCPLAGRNLLRVGLRRRRKLLNFLLRIGPWLNLGVNNAILSIQSVSIGS